MFNQLQSMFRRTEGQVTILFALATVPLLIAAGAAIDRIRLDNTRTEMQAALDGATLAAANAENRTNKQREMLARKYFKANFASAEENSTDFTVDVTASTVIANVHIDYPMTFMRLAGVASATIDITAEVMRPFEGKAEVVLVLDYSGSMNRLNKYQDMAAAAEGMIDELDNALTDNALKIGLVPFSAMVYTSMDKSFVTQASVTATWTGCTQDRKYPYNTTVDTPTADSDTKWGFDRGLTTPSRPGDPPRLENAGIYSCAYYNSKNLKIIPLTANMSDLKTKLQAMRPIGNTNIPLGAEFGWNLLDPQEPYTEGAPYSDTKTRKYLVLLTDGVQTSGQFDNGGGRSIAQGNANLLALCTNMRNAGVTVFAIAYDITDPAVTTLLKTCAPDRYYEPDSGATEIKQVFSQITSQIKNSRIRVSR